MKRLLCIVIALLILPAAIQTARTQSSQAPAALPADADITLLRTYCVTCHNDRSRTGGLSLEGKDVRNAAGDPELWEKVIRKLRAGLMPPSGANRPDRATLEGLRTAIEASIDGAASVKASPGATPLHRLNRNEYANAIRDLIAVDVDPATLLPPDDSLEGFDNIADVLGFSPALIERYVSAAAKISRLAVGNTEIGPSSVTYRVRGDLSQDEHIEGLPLGTRGGIVIRHAFPVDGEYLFRFSMLKLDFGWQYAIAAKGEQLEMSVNGERVLLREMPSGIFYYIPAANAPPGSSNGTPPPIEFRLPVKAGPQTIAVTFTKKTSAAVDDLVEPFESTTGDPRIGAQFGYTTVPHLSAVEILGPYAITGPGTSPSRDRIFVCRPSQNIASEETACASQILRALARRAYRRPVTDVDLEPLLAFYRTGRETGAFDSGIEMALRRILSDPQFVFRVERDPAGLAPGAAYRINDFELASRLSFFLWSSIPDDELLDLAEKRALGEPAVLEQQVRRMLKDSRSQSLVRNFAGQWLYLRELRNKSPDLLIFPDFDDNLRQAFQRETELLFETIVREDRNILELLNADYTFVNERLATHYGIPNIYGTDFRRISVPASARRGLLGHGSFLTLTSATNRTSPVTRGAWILENLLGSPPPLPPPDVPNLPENTTGQGVSVVPSSVRTRMIQHRANPVCSSCHQIMDPIGLALENFDAIGRWRNNDSGTAIDASGKLVDGTEITGPESLRNALLVYRDAVVETTTEKLLMYAVGRAAHYYDMPAVRRIAREASRNDYRFSSLILGIVNSDPFRMRMTKAELQ